MEVEYCEINWKAFKPMHLGRLVYRNLGCVVFQIN